MTAPDDFLAAYDEMRDLQKRFFAGDKTVVGRAKAAERKCDRLREAIANRDKASLSAGPNLFTEEVEVCGF